MDGRSGRGAVPPGLPAGGRRISDARRVLALVCTSVMARHGSFVVGRISTVDSTDRRRSQSDAQPTNVIADT
jgi:hypothetical protein